MNSVMSLMYEMQAHFFFTVLPKIAYSIFHTCYRKEGSTSDVALVLQTKHEYENNKKMMMKRQGSGKTKEEVMQWPCRFGHRRRTHGGPAIPFLLDYDNFSQFFFI